jgi:uncharacterized protein (TIGR03437 family)
VSKTGTSVAVNDSMAASPPAPLLFVSPGQVDSLVPATVALGSASIVLNAAIGEILAEARHLVFAQLAQKNVNPQYR